MKKIDFNSDWRFTKTGTGEEQAVTLPHDAMLQEARSQENPSGSAGAYFAGGAYTYEKYFEAPESWKDKKLILVFEGVYNTAAIYLNDEQIGAVYYGYSVTEVDLTGKLAIGKNALRVEVDNLNQPNSRWYSGAGIYRPVWLYVLHKGGIELRGVKIKTLSINPARIQVSVSHQEGEAAVSIWDGEDMVASGSGSELTLEIPDAKLWSDETPNLYRCQVDLSSRGEVIDQGEVCFGIRTVEWSPEGLFINGKETLLRGGCVHSDNGVLGACSYEEAEWRRVRILKENGFNAIRSSHNHASAAMLEACDHLGMYLMDEAWDMWYRHKTKHDYAARFPEHYKEDIKSLVENDYNHPSVIFYSIGNEVSEPAEEKGLALEKEMAELIHRMDDSRAVTAGFNLMIIANAAKGQQLYDGEGGLNAESADSGTKPDMSKMDSTMFNMIANSIGTNMNNGCNSDEADAAITPTIDALDIGGYNYSSGRYPLEGGKHSGRIIFGSETFPPDIAKNWAMVKKYPYLLGDFMWTAWDYMGEAGIGTWTEDEDAMAFEKPYPWLLGGSGVIDILGNPDGEALYNQAVWELSANPGIAVRPVNRDADKTIHSAWRGTDAIPSWSWRGCEGRKAFIEVYSSAAEVELSVNGVSLGKKSLEEYKTVFETAYQAGTIKAIAYDNQGRETGRSSLCSAEGGLKISVMPETKPYAGKLLYVDIAICGENGIVESNADSKLTVSVVGGDLLGYGSANPKTAESYLSGRFTTYRGRSLAVIRAGSGPELKISVQGGGMSTADVFKIYGR